MAENGANLRRENVSKTRGQDFRRVLRVVQIFLSDVRAKLHIAHVLALDDDCTILCWPRLVEVSCTVDVEMDFGF